MKRILILQLGVYGDCLYATTIARQIKQDYPDCYLTWAIGKKYADILKNNLHVDKVVSVRSVNNRFDVTSKWYAVAEAAEDLKRLEEYDEVYLTQAYPGNPDTFYDSPREAMFRMYPNPITVPLDPVVRLSTMECRHVLEFATEHELFKRKHVILFERSPESNQSFITEKFVLTVANIITHTIPNSCVILSSNKSIKSDNPDIIDGSVLTFRENAELTTYCNLFIGTGSGITQLCQSDWAKPLPTILLLRNGTVASLISDNEYFNLPVDKIIEMSYCDELHLLRCVQDIVNYGFEEARQKYCEKLTPDFNIIRFHMRFDKAMHYHRYLDIPIAMLVTMQEYGFSKGLIDFIATFPESIGKLITRRLHGVE